MNAQPSRSLATRLAGPACVAATGVALTAWTWRTWPDVTVDFGGELYVAWRIAQGDVLYRDLAYFTGPLSPYANAAWFELFGTSLMTLALVNLALLAATTALLYRLLARLGGAFGATVACIVFLALCGLAEHQGAGNYNFVCPYSHEMVHGTLLALLALTALERWIAAPKVVTAACIGLAAGAVFLTKVEFTAALFAAIASAVALAIWRGALASREAVRSCAVLVAAALVAPLVAFAALSAAMPARDALRGVLGAWVHASDERISSLPLYRAALGVLPLDYNLQRLVAWSVALAAFVWAGIWIARRTRAETKGVTFAAAAVVSIALAASFTKIEWVDSFRPLPLLALAIFASALLALRRHFEPKLALRAAFASFALVLLLRIVLSARVQFYGFALAAPGVALFVLALVDWIPGWVRERGGSASVVRACVLPLIAAIVAGHLVPMGKALADKRILVGRGRDAFLADPRGEYVRRALEALEQRAPADGTLLVVPEGAMLNYLARRRSPTRYFNYMPPELLMFGESEIVRALDAAPAELCVLLHKDTSEYGLPLFGRDYARDVLSWIRAHYTPVRLWSVDQGSKPLEPGTRYAIAVLERKR